MCHRSYQINGHFVSMFKLPPHTNPYIYLLTLSCAVQTVSSLSLSLSLSEVSWTLTNLETQIQIRFKLLVPYSSWRLWTTKTQALCLVSVNHWLSFSASFSSFMLLFELFSLHNLKFKSHSLFVWLTRKLKGKKKTEEKFDLIFCFGFT